VIFIELWFFRFLHAYNLKGVDIRSPKEIGKEFFLWEGKYVHEPFVLRQGKFTVILLS